MPEFQKQNKFDLEERTASFGEGVIKFCKTIKQDAVSNPLISQIVRSSTSIGANYCEASGASSKKIFEIKYLFAEKKRVKQNIG